MEKLVLYQEDLDRLTEILGEIPFKYAKPVWDFFALLIKKQNELQKKQEVEEVVEEKIVGVDV